MLTLALSIAEIFTHVGWVKQYLYVPTAFWQFLSIIISASYFDPLLTLNRKLHKYFITGLLVTLSVLLIQQALYPASLGFDLSALTRLLAYMGALYLCSSSKPLLLKLGYASLIYGLVLVGSDSLLFVTRRLKTNLTELLTHPSYNYDQKMAVAYPGFYPVIKTIKNLTPPNSVIIIPPQDNPWETEGNTAIVRYFLYPRTLTHSLDYHSLTKQPVYAMIARGSWPSNGRNPYGWPTVALASRVLWQFDNQGNIINRYQRSFDPTTDQWDWGLMELPNE